MKRLFLATLVLLLSVLSVSAQSYDFKRKWSADKGDGTFVNPILNGDFPDCDVIRVDSTFYLMSTTMYHFPGATILKSHDLVNWEYCCNPLKQIEDNDAYNLLNGGSHYAQGQWATSLRYHNGKFYVYFISYGRSGFDSGRNVLMTATDPEGEWTMEYWPEHYYDSGWLFDDGADGDGYVYVACGIGSIYVNKLNPNTLAKISSTKVFERESHEGSRMYHIGGYYYIYLTTGGYWKGQTILRSTNPLGPYEEFTDVNRYNLFQGDAVHQGGLVDTPTGEWWTILFKDAGAIGRTPFLEPVTWKDGWPQIGQYMDDRWADVSYEGAKYKKPDVGKEYPKTYLPTNDAFASDTLGMQWQWNHNPQTQAWSLTQRPGWMRLYSCTVTDNLVSARGSLTQRILGYSPNGTASSSWVPNYGTVKMDLSGMKEGDVAGLSVFQNPYSFIGVMMKDGKKYLCSKRYTFDSQAAVLVDSVWSSTELTSDTIYLRAISNFGTNACNYYYSYQAGSGYKKFGVSMTMNYTLDVFVGQRYYIFNYSTIATGGHVDIDWFSTEQVIPVDYFAQLDANEDIPSEPVETWNGFPLDKEHFNPSIIGSGTFTSSTKFLKTAANGLGGWQYPEPWDISQFKYIVVNLLKTCSFQAEVRIYDSNNIWAEPYVVSLKGMKSVAIDLNNMITASGYKLDPSHISIVAFNSDGSGYIYFKSVYLSDDGSTETGIKSAAADTESTQIYDLIGRMVQTPRKGVYIKNGKKFIVKDPL